MKFRVGGWQMASQLPRLCRQTPCPGFKRGYASRAEVPLDPRANLALYGSGDPR